MQIAICIYKVFGYGGIPRDMFKIARESLSRGHKIRVYALRWLVEPTDEFDVVMVPVKAMANHNLYKKYTAWVGQHLAENPVDLVLGMNKMPGLDVYYAGDSCYEEKSQEQRTWLYRLTPRYKHFSEYEKAVFLPDKKTLVLTISDTEKPYFKKHYNTPEERFAMLPPGIERDRAGIEVSITKVAEIRAEHQLADKDTLLVFIGSGFIKKGLDRLLLGIMKMPEPYKSQCKLLILGEDRTDAFERMVRRLGIGGQVEFLGGRDDVPDYLAAADGMVLPAYDENTGTVILEAVIAGVPVLTTENCGYAHYVLECNAGLVVPMPYSQEVFDVMLVELITSNMRQTWIENGRKLANDERIYSLAQRAVDYIEQWQESRRQA